MFNSWRPQIKCISGIIEKLFFYWLKHRLCAFHNFICIFLLLVVELESLIFDVCIEIQRNVLWITSATHNFYDIILNSFIRYIESQNIWEVPTLFFFLLFSFIYFFPWVQIVFLLLCYMVNTTTCISTFSAGYMCTCL